MKIGGINDGHITDDCTILLVLLLLFACNGKKIFQMFFRRVIFKCCFTFRQNLMLTFVRKIDCYINNPNTDLHFRILSKIFLIKIHFI